MIVCGINDNALRERLLRDSELTLSRTISAGHVAEETQKHAYEIVQSQQKKPFESLLSPKSKKGT